MSPARAEVWNCISEDRAEDRKGGSEGDLQLLSYAVTKLFSRLNARTDAGFC